jgi:hypothetical protein
VKTDRATAKANWMSVESAAAILGLAPVSLRRAIERGARRSDGGVVETRMDGLTARKFGRRWRVQLDAGWTAISPARRAS